MALIKCPDCGRDVSDQAVACPNCGYPINSPEKSPEAEPPSADAAAPSPPLEVPPKKGGCLKGMLVGLLAVVLIGVGLFLEKDPPRVNEIAPVGTVNISASKEEEYVARMGREKYQAEMEKIRLIPRLTVFQLVRLFEANEIAADQQYKGQEVIVIGNAADVSKSMLGAPKISMRTSSGKQKTLVVTLRRREEDAAAKVNKGERVTLRGVVTRSLTGKVGLKNGSFFDENDPLASETQGD